MRALVGYAHEALEVRLAQLLLDDADDRLQAHRVLAAVLVVPATSSQQSYTYVRRTRVTRQAAVGNRFIDTYVM